MPNRPREWLLTACRWLVHAAGWIVPRPSRSEWRAKWDASLWNWWTLFERGELTGRSHARLVRFCWESVFDAFWLRLSREHVRSSLRGPGFLLATAAVVLIATAVLTRGFSGTRALFEPLPLADSGSLVSIRYSGAAGDSSGVPAQFVPLWRAKSELLSGVAGFRHPRRSSHAWVTTDFFSLLGTSAAAGRTFRPGDADVAVLSGETWRTVYNADPEIIGKSITLGGRQYTVVGALPDSFWALSNRIEVWIPLVLDPQPASGVPPLIGSVGRVKPGVSETKLRRELFEIARTANRLLPRPPEVARFTAVPQRALFAYLLGIAFALTVGAVMVASGRWSAARHGWRYWSFFALKTLSAVLIPSLLWIELGAVISTRTPDSGFGVLLRVLFPLVFMLGCACALWWSFTDQRRRCPVCLQRLAMPVSIGSWASMFEPATTELLCEAGHGSMCVPEAQTDEPDRWTALDSSWRDLFSGKP
jgi:hypothetical protein